MSSTPEARFFLRRLHSPHENRSPAGTADQAPREHFHTPINPLGTSSAGNRLAPHSPRPGEPIVRESTPREAGVGRPTSTHPDIPSPVPSVVPRDPDPASMQRRSRALDHHRRRRTAANDNLSVCRARTQHDPAYSDEQAFLHSHATSGNCSRARTAYTIWLLPSQDGPNCRRNAKNGFRSSSPARFRHPLHRGMVQSESLQRCRILFPPGQPRREWRHSRPGQEGHYRDRSGIHDGVSRFAGVTGRPLSAEDDGVVYSWTLIGTNSGPGGTGRPGAHRRLRDVVHRRGRIDR